MSKQQLFGAKINPSCSYCRFGTVAPDGRMVLCVKQGVVDCFYACRRFEYSPLKRVPTRPRMLPQYDSKEFQL